MVTWFVGQYHPDCLLHHVLPLEAGQKSLKLLWFCETFFNYLVLEL